MDSTRREPPRSAPRPAAGGRWFYAGAAHSEALARLDFVVEQRRQCGLLVGPEGTGKSLLLERLAEAARRRQRPAVLLDLLGAGGDELLWELAAALQLGPAAGDSPWQLWRGVADHLRGLCLSGQQLILLIDHLDRAEPDCARVLERMLSCGRGTSGALTMIVATRGGTGRAQRLLAELCDLRIDVPSLDRDDVAGYVRQWLRQAGADRDLFDESAIDRLHERSRGVPRVLARLCELARLAAESESTEASSDLIDEIMAELPLA